MREGGAAVDNAFSVTRELPRRVNGAWTVVEQPLFPGYVFVATHDVDTLSDCFASHDGERSARSDIAIECLPRKESDLLLSLMGEGGCIRISRGDIVDGCLRVSEGPLRGHEDLIAKVDRHKRLAYLHSGALAGLEALSIWNANTANNARRLGLCLGLEVVSKS